MEGRHTGSLDYLLQARYWGRFFTWNFSKGVGISLVLAMVLGVRHLSFSSRERKTVLGWALGIVPYWLLVRDGNYIHDYYSLYFVPGLALLGIIAVSAIPVRALRWALLAFSVILGLAQPLSLARNAVGGEHSYCNYEISQIE